MSDRPDPSVPHGALLWHGAAGEMVAGEPIQELAYRTLGNPEGIRASHLKALDPAEQAETICSWMHANYQPRTHGHLHSPGVGTATALLGSIFGGVLISPVLQAAAAELDEQSDRWEPTSQNSWNDARPLSRGVMWRPRRFGDAMGKPYRERVYVTPAYPNGITDGELHRLSADEQAEIGKFWFLSNYEPYVAGAGLIKRFTDGARFADGTGFIDGAPAINHGAAREILRKEFAAVFRFGARSRLVGELDAFSSEWALIPHRLITGEPVVDPRVEAVARLKHLGEIVTHLAAASGGMGHNGGPPLPEDQRIAITQTIEQASAALDAGDVGRPAIEAAKSRLGLIAAVVGTTMVLPIMAGFGKEIGKRIADDSYDPMKHLAIQLFHALHEAALVLGHVLSTMPPPALL